MKLKRRLVFNIMLATFVASLALFLSEKGLVKRLEYAGLDLVFRIRGGTGVTSPKIVIVEITDSDVAAIGRWPWDRSWYAAMTRALSQFGAQQVFFDILLAEPSNEQNDALLEQSLKLAKNVYLPVVFQDISPGVKTVYMPMDRFFQHLKGTGALNIYPDIDGTIRRVPLIFTSLKSVYPHVAVQIAADYLGYRVRGVNPKYLSLGLVKEDVQVPFQEYNRMLINWVGKWSKTFKHYAFLDILAAYKAYTDGKKPDIDLNDFKGAICLVGATAIGLYDIKPIPIEGEYPGVGVIATAISNIVNRNFLYSPPLLVNVLILFLLTLFPALIISGEKPLQEITAVLLGAIIYVLVGYILFQNNIIINLALPIIGMFIGYLVVASYNLMMVSVERKTFMTMSITDTLTGLYNMRHFNALMENELAVAQRDVKHKMCILMVDIDHFKHFNDTYGHQVGDLVLREVAHVLKNSLRAADVLARYGGEEMIILLRGVSLENGLSAAEKIVKNIEAHTVKEGDNTHKVTVSIGVAGFKQDETLESFIRRADAGLYQAKESGRNRACTVEKI